MECPHNSQKQTCVCVCVCVCVFVFHRRNKCRQAWNDMILTLTLIPTSAINADKNILKQYTETIL